MTELAKRKRAIPQYGTVTLNGIDYYRTRVQNADGKLVALYARTPEELYDKELGALEQIDNDTFCRKSPTVADYCEKWLLMQSVHVRATTLIDYTSKVRRHIIKELGQMRMADVKLADTGDGNDGTDACFLYLYFIQTIKLVQLADLGLDDLVGVVVVTDDHILIHTDGTVVYLTDTDTSYIFIIIDGTDQYLGSCLGVTFGSGNVVDDGLEQRLHISTHLVGIQGSNTCLGGSVHKRTV